MTAPTGISGTPRPLHDVTVGVLTISDRCYRGESEDTSGPELVESMKTMLQSNFKV